MDDLVQPLSQNVPDRIWLMDLGSGNIVWCQDPDPDGEQVDAVEYVRADRITALEAALKLAANRLHRCSVDYETGTRQFIEVGEWAEEARQALGAPHDCNG